jgi:chaperonin GroES
MPVRLTNGMKVEYRSEEWDGKDTSRIKVVGKCVLVLTDKVVKSSGGIEFDPGMTDRFNSSADSGILVACAPGAFLLNEDMRPWTGDKPKPGDYIYFEKYAGTLVTGLDNRVYRLMDYGNIGATYEPEIEQKTGDK